MELTVSSKKASEFLNVNESTIKRWADSGVLKCFKTPGGHRKFKIEDLKNLAQSHNFETANLNSLDSSSSLQFHIHSRNYKILQNTFEKYILKGDTAQAYNFLYSLYINNYSLEEIFDSIIKECMKTVGLKWETKTLPIENEHIATNTVLASLNQLEKVIQKKTSIKRTAVCSGFENEYHGIGLLCVKIALESAGWKVIYPGINLPFNSLMQLINKNKPELVCLSAKNITDSHSFGLKIKKIKNLIEAKRGMILIGGLNDQSGEFNDLYCDSIKTMNIKLKENKV